MVEEVRSAADLQQVVNEAKSLVVIHFRAEWCDASRQMDAVFEQLCAETAPRARFFQVEAEEHADISEKYSVSAVPYFIFLKDGKIVDSLEGADPAELSNKVTKLAESPVENGTKEVEVKQVKPVDLEALVNSNPVMLFMKGSPAEPKCGFSRKVVAALEEEGVPFGSFDILTNEEVRQGMKAFANWPTFPQLYVKGELIGGCDIILEMHSNGELKEVLAEKGIKQEINVRLKKLVNSSETMLFMKGTPEEPKCGFSRKVSAALKEDGISFGSFDILSDEDVRQGLKTFSNWPTYPQLYHKGELIGGCDIILEMKENGELKEALA